MNKGRELLERAFESMKNRNLLTENERNLEKEISYYLLSTPEPTQDEESTLLTKEELGAIMLDWMNTPKSRDSDLYRAVQQEVLKKNGCPAPRPEFVRLSEENVIGIVRADPDFDEMMWDDTSIRFARAIEDALEEKNK